MLKQTLRILPLSSLLLIAPLARASYVVTTFATANTNSLGAVASAAYNTYGCCSGSAISSSAVPGDLASADGTVDVTGLLRAAYDQVSVFSPGSPYNSTASGYAAVDLAAGVWRASGSAGGSASGDQAGVNSHASFSDTLHFSVAGASPTTVTYIGVTFTSDGTISIVPSGANGALIYSDATFGGGTYTSIMSADSTCAAGCFLSEGVAGWTSYSFATDIPGNVVFHGTYAITGASADVGVSGFLDIRANGVGAPTAALVDFSHTNIFSLTLPGNVTYNSDSGVFATAPVPEPASMGAIGIGLIALAGWRLRLRR